MYYCLHMNKASRHKYMPEVSGDMYVVEEVQPEIVRAKRLAASYIELVVDATEENRREHVERAREEGKRVWVKDGKLHIGGLGEFEITFEGDFPVVGVGDEAEEIPAAELLIPEDHIRVMTDGSTILRIWLDDPASPDFSDQDQMARVFAQSNPAEASEPPEPSA